ncbi:hypothetical protein [Legionella sp. CNM-4043-24]|uniref:hypothetical protein n=1 Tax=Legionella sp. CNM-4043-24 TaxID=3421646 RepID=UPI00403ACB1E
MNAKEFADFCTELGFLFEQTITDESLTKEYTGELDVVAASRGEEACWATRDVVTVASKKNLLLTSWYFDTLDDTSRAHVERFFLLLLREGYTLALSTANGIKPIENSASLRRQLADFTPVRLADDVRLTNTALINAAALLAIVNKMSGETHALVQHAMLPTEFREKDCARLESTIAQDDALGLTLDNFFTANPVLKHPALCQKVRQLKLTIQHIQPFDIDLIMMHFKHIEQLELSSLKIDSRLLQLLLTLPNLKKLTIDRVEVLSQDECRILSDPCNLTELTISRSDLNSSQLSALLQHSPHLNRLILKKNAPHYKEPLTLLPDTLLSLDALTLDEPDLIPQHRNALIDAAPNLTALSLSDKVMSRAVITSKPSRTEWDINALKQGPSEQSHFHDNENHGFSSASSSSFDNQIQRDNQYDHTVDMWDFKTPSFGGSSSAAGQPQAPSSTQWLNQRLEAGQPTLRKITHLKLEGASLETLTFEQHVGSPSLLKSLDLSNTQNVSAFIEKILTDRPEALAALTHCILDGSDISGNALHMLMLHCPRLTHLSVANCTQLTTYQPQDLPALQKGQLSAFNAANSGLTPTQASSILNASPALSFLNLKDTQNCLDGLRLPPGHLLLLQTAQLGKWVDRDSFGSLWQAAPNLTSLIMDGSNIGIPSTLRQGQLMRIQAIDSLCHEDHVATLIRSNPGLTCLDISRSHLLGTYLVKRLFNPDNISLTQLTAFHADGVGGLSEIQLDNLFQTAPDLSVIRLDRASLDHDCHDFSPKKMPLLRVLSAHNCDEQTKKLLINLLEGAANLEEFTASWEGSEYGSFAQLPPNSLSRLRTVRLARVSESNELSGLLRAAPNITKLSLNDIQLNTPEAFKLKSNQLRRLTELDVSDSNISLQQLMSIINAAPGLERVVVNACYALSQENIEYIQSNYPQIRIEGAAQIEKYADFDSEPDSDRPDMSFPSDYAVNPAKRGIKTWGDFQNNPDTHHTAQSIFIGDASTPRIPTGFYHLQTYRWDAPEQLFTPYVPDASNLESVHPARMNLSAIRRAREAGQLHASWELPQLEANTWYQLPATSTQDTLTAFAASVPGQNFELVHDRESGYHFFRVPVSHPVPISFRFNLTPGFGQDTLVRDNADTTELQTLIRQLRFDASGHLQQNETWSEVMRASTQDILSALQAVCTFEKESGDNTEGEPWQIFNHMLEHREGACRHRAQLFVVLATELQIPACYQTNASHAFAIARTEDNALVTLQLGGAEAHLTELPVPDDDEVEEEQAEPENAFRHDVMTLAPEPHPTNRYQTWNSHPLQGTEAQLLIDEILTNSRLLIQQLVVTEDKTSLECLHRAIVKQYGTEGHCLYTSDIDTISLTAPQIRENQFESTPSAIARLITRAENHPDEPFTWFIDWSDAKLKHKGLHSLISGTPRQLFGHILPDNLHVVVMMDKAALANTGDTLTSLLPARSLAPRLTPPPRPPETHKPVEQGDAVITQTLDWKKILLGGPVFEGRQATLTDGALLSALSRGATSLTIHNPPMENKAFMDFLIQLEEIRQFEVNGEIHHLPDGFSFHLAQPLISFSDRPFDYDAFPHKDNSVTLALNAASYNSFFSMMRLDENGFHTMPGLMEQHKEHVIHLAITSDLTPLQWWEITEEAVRHGICLVLEPCPGISLPKALSRHALPAAWLNNDASHVRFHPSTDSDWAMRAPNDYETVVPISLNTRFESLFITVQRQPDGRITATDSDLLQAIKRGERVILKGRFSLEFVQKLSSIFTRDRALIVNGERIPIKNEFIILSEDTNSFEILNSSVFSSFDSQSLVNDALCEPARKILLACYDRLKISPCYAHFQNCPEEASAQIPWAQQLVTSLELAAGKPPVAAAPSNSGSSSAVITNQVSTPEELMAYLNSHPFAFLISESGAGKSYLMQNLLPKYGKEINQPITVYNNLSDLEVWARHTSGNAILFIDEANISTQDYLMFDNLARGQRVLWINGQRFDLSDQQKVVFAGNPYAYGGRMQADLFRRYPCYVAFKTQPLHELLSPMLSTFEDPAAALEMVDRVYQAALRKGITMTTRNALMVCLRVAELKLHQNYRLFPEKVLLQYALLNELKGIKADKTDIQAIRADIKADALWRAQGQELRQALCSRLPETSRDFHWTPARIKVALALLGFLSIRKQKHEQNTAQELGTNGFLLEGQGLGKGRLIMEILTELKLDPPLKIISLDNPRVAREQLIDAHRKGLAVYIPKFSSLIDERLVNELLSTPGEKAGFCILGVHDGSELSKALSNRFTILNLKEDSIEDLQVIIQTASGAPQSLIDTHLEEFRQARAFGVQQNLSPIPTGRTIFEQVKKARDDPDADASSSLAP